MATRSIHAVAWVLLAVAAFLLWPERWGGSMTYVVTNGSSMAPTWQAGDLAVLRSADDYAVGDVAAYDSRDVQSIVMHRIIEESPRGYTFQGDNNDHVDPETVAPQQVLGKLVVRVPGLGRALGWILQPVNLVLAGLALVLLLGDRKKEPAGAGAGTVVRLRSLQLPRAVVRAELADEADLHRLAERCGRPVLEVDGDERRYLVDGGVVYTWAATVVEAPGTRPKKAPAAAATRTPAAPARTAPAAATGTSAQQPAELRPKLPRPRATARSGERGVSPR